MALIQLMRLDKPWGFVLLVCPSLWALWIANRGMPEVQLVCIFIAGALIMRSFGCVVNDIWDLDIDACVARTQTRPLADGRLSKKSAVLTGMVLASMAASLLFFLNRAGVWCAVMGLILSCVYPSAKRWMRCPQLFLGVTFAWGVPMAFAASGCHLGFDCWFLYVITVMWVVGYDAIYAMQDLPDDRRLPIYTMPKSLQGDIQTVVAYLYGCFGLGFAVVVAINRIGFGFYPFWLMAVVMLFWQVCILRRGSGDRYPQAFKSNQWLGLVLWLGLMVGGFPI